MLIIIYVILLIIGAKSTWKLVQSLIPTSVDDVLGLVIAVAIFAVIFMIVSPIMGVVTAGKYIITYFGSGTSKTDEKTGTTR